MTTLFNYLLEGSFCIAIIYLFYKIALSELTFFNYNRIFLLGGLALSCLIPLVTFQNFYSVDFIPQYFNNTLPEFEVVNTGNSGSMINLYSLLFGVYIIGTFWKICSLLGGFFHIFIQLRKAIKIKHEGHYIAINSNFEPSAFFNYVLLPDFDSNSKRDAILILHESVHAKKLHSLDLLFLQILGVIFWFHPLLSLFEKSLREIHEYQADSVVLANKSKKEYAMVLLDLIKGNYEGKLSNHFNQFQTKKRILMMYRKTSERHLKVRFLLSIPLLAVLLFVFSCENTKEDALTESELNRLTQDNEAAKNDDANEIFDVVEEAPTYPGGMPGWSAYLGENLKYPKAAKERGAEGTSIVAFVINKNGELSDIELIRGFDDDCDAEAIRVISQSQKWMPGKQRGRDVNVRMRVPIKFKLS